MLPIIIYINKIILKKRSHSCTRPHACITHATDSKRMGTVGVINFRRRNASFVHFRSLTATNVARLDKDYKQRDQLESNQSYNYSSGIFKAAAYTFISTGTAVAALRFTATQS